MVGRHTGTLSAGGGPEQGPAEDKVGEELPGAGGGPEVQLALLERGKVGVAVGQWPLWAGPAPVGLCRPQRSRRDPQEASEQAGHDGTGRAGKRGLQAEATASQERSWGAQRADRPCWGVGEGGPAQLSLTCCGEAAAPGAASQGGSRPPRCRTSSLSASSTWTGTCSPSTSRGPSTGCLCWRRRGSSPLFAALVSGRPGGNGGCPGG